jgi:hypothetical protein
VGEGDESIGEHYYAYVKYHSARAAARARAATSAGQVYKTYHQRFGTGAAVDLAPCPVAVLKSTIQLIMFLKISQYRYLKQI